MTIEEINDKCVAFRNVCDEMLTRYRARLVSEENMPKTLRDKYLDEVSSELEFLVDAADSFNEKIMYVNLDIQGLHDSYRAICDNIRKEYRERGISV